MTAVASAAHRERLLRALGMTPWVRRSVSSSANDAMPEWAMDTVPALAGDCVVVLPAGCAPRELDLLGRALLSCGPLVARAPRIEVAGGELPSAPEARAYLVLGEAQARALGRVLPAATLASAHIVLADEPASVLASGASKRRLWNALRNLRRALTSSPE